MVNMPCSGGFLYCLSFPVTISYQPGFRMCYVLSHMQSGGKITRFCDQQCIVLCIRNCDEAQRGWKLEISVICVDLYSITTSEKRQHTCTHSLCTSSTYSLSWQMIYLTHSLLTYWAVLPFFRAWAALHISWMS